MPTAALRAYSEALERHKAELQIMFASAALLPYQKSEEQQRLVSLWQAQARGFNETNETVLGETGQPKQYVLNAETGMFEELAMSEPQFRSEVNENGSQS